jgi:hypothetical protein
MIEQNIVALVVAMLGEHWIVSGQVSLLRTLRMM